MKERALNDVASLEIALERANELKMDAISYLEKRSVIRTGFTSQADNERRRNRILELFQADEADWNDWKWQMRNRISDPRLLGEVLHLDAVEQKRIEKVGNVYRWAVSPYYLSLIDEDYHNSPIYRQAVPDIRELVEGGSLDPMQEALTSPAPCVTRRYPDRLIINVTNVCPMFCRHCQRRRNIGENDQNVCRDDIKQALDYVAGNPEIRDVLITGGDALMLGDQTLDWLLTELDNIPHVEIKRIGTRTPVTLPQRITPALCQVLSNHPPIYINTQFNHPLEVTAEAKMACDRLVEAGAVLGNQAVLLRGINDDPDIMKSLNHELLRIRVRPYYIFHPKEVKGTSHWWVSIRCGLDIMESLRGHTSGLAVPTYILNAPGGLGKIPLAPQYILGIEPGKVKLRTWEGKIVEIADGEDVVYN